MGANFRIFAPARFSDSLALLFLRQSIFVGIFHSFGPRSTRFIRFFCRSGQLKLLRHSGSNSETLKIVQDCSDSDQSDFLLPHGSSLNRVLRMPKKILSKEDHCFSKMSHHWCCPRMSNLMELRVGTQTRQTLKWPAGATIISIFCIFFLKLLSVDICDNKVMWKLFTM